MKELTLEQIALQAREGNERAMTYLINRFRNPILGQLMKFAYSKGMQEDAEDICQEAFIKVFLKISKFNPEKAKFSTWIYRVAKNCFIDEVRKKDRVYILSLESLVVFKDDESSGRMEFNIPDNKLIGDELMEKKARIEIVQKAVHKVMRLNKDWGICIYLRYFEELSYKEISDKLGEPLGTIKAKLFNAHNLLREELEKTGISIQ